MEYFHVDGLESTLLVIIYYLGDKKMVLMKKQSPFTTISNFTFQKG